MDTLTPAARDILSAVARQEVVRDYYSRGWRRAAPNGGQNQLRELTADESNALAGLEEAGLVSCPPPSGRHDRYLDITDKALEAGHA